MNPYRQTITAVVTALFLTFVAVPTEVSAAGLDQPCRRAGATATARSKGKAVRVRCSRVGGKLRWVQVKSNTKKPTISPTTSLAGTVSQRNASSRAASYLRSSAFSRSGLISQLQFEGFSLEDATYGVDAQQADWNAQAVKKAASYLRTSAFSRTGLISQMEYEGFSNAQAVFGVDTQKADWNAQAAKKAASYLRSSAFSRSGLLSQLLYEGFTQGEAEFGVGTTGL